MTAPPGNTPWVQDVGVPSPIFLQYINSLDLLANNALAASALAAQLAPLLRSYLAGLTLSTAGSSSTFSVAAGVAADSTNASIMSLASSISKTTGAWAAGTGNGALDTGAIANSTWYHVHLIKNVTTLAVDVLVSLSASAPTLPSGYTLSRRIGSMLTNGSSQWTLFTQAGDEFVWSVPFGDVNTGALGTSAVLFGLSVPTGVKVAARFRFNMANATAGAAVLISSPDEASAAGGTPGGNWTAQCQISNFGFYAGQHHIFTNTSAQIRAIASTASTQLLLATYGWTDRRGRDL